MRVSPHFTLCGGWINLNPILSYPLEEMMGCESIQSPLWSILCTRVEETSNCILSSRGESVGCLQSVRLLPELPKAFQGLPGPHPRACLAQIIQASRMGRPSQVSWAEELQIWSSTWVLVIWNLWHLSFDFLKMKSTGAIKAMCTYMISLNLYRSSQQLL